jgi:hypothetical protein
MAEEGAKAGMAVHGNEYHDPDFEQEGAAAVLVEAHRTTQVHTQDQPPAEHGNAKHNPDFEQEGVAASLVGTHEAKTTGIHGVGGSTVESASGSQGKVDTHEAKTTGIHGVGASTIESASGAQGKVDTHEAKTTGVHGAGSNYLAQAPAASHLVRTFTKGWTSGKLLKGAGVNADPVEISGWEVLADIDVVSAVVYVDFTSLDINTDKLYILVLNIKHAVASPMDYMLYRSADYTNTNYYTQWINASGTTVSANRGNFPAIHYVPANGAQFSVAYITRDSGGYFHALAFFDYDRASAVAATIRFINSSNTTANVTSLRVYTNSGNNGIDIGSRLTLCKPRTA